MQMQELTRMDLSQRGGEAETHFSEAGKAEGGSDLSHT